MSNRYTAVVPSTPLGIKLCASALDQNFTQVTWIDPAGVGFAAGMRVGDVVLRVNGRALTASRQMLNEMVLPASLDMLRPRHTSATDVPQPRSRSRRKGRKRGHTAITGSAGAEPCWPHADGPAEYAHLEFEHTFWHHGQLGIAAKRIKTGENSVDVRDIVTRRGFEAPIPRQDEVIVTDIRAGGLCARLNHGRKDHECGDAHITGDSVDGIGVVAVERGDVILTVNGRRAGLPTMRTCIEGVEDSVVGQRQDRANNAEEQEQEQEREREGEGEGEPGQEQEPEDHLTGRTAHEFGEVAVGH